MKLERRIVVVMATAAVVGAVVVVGWGFGVDVACFGGVVVVVVLVGVVVDEFD